MTLKRIVSGGHTGVERRDLDIIFRAGVDPLRCAVLAARKPRVVKRQVIARRSRG
jgi:hypothetical protein